MRKAKSIVLLLLFLQFGCASLSKMSPKADYHPKPNKFNIYSVKIWNDGTLVHGQVMADNMSVHDLGGFVECNWSENSGNSISHETQDFDLKSGEKKLLEYSTLSSAGLGRMHLACEIAYLVCHDCGEKVVINK